MNETDTRNEDWLRTMRWSQRTASGKIVETLDELIEALDGIMPLDQFLRLPAAEPMPESIREEINQIYVKHLPGEHDQSSHGNWVQLQLFDLPRGFETVDLTDEDISRMRASRSALRRGMRRAEGDWEFLREELDKEGTDYFEDEPADVAQLMWDEMYDRGKMSDNDPKGWGPWIQSFEACRDARVAMARMVGLDPASRHTAMADPLLAQSVTVGVGTDYEIAHGMGFTLLRHLSDNGERRPDDRPLWRGIASEDTALLIEQIESEEGIEGTEIEFVPASFSNRAGLAASFADAAAQWDRGGKWSRLLVKVNNAHAVTGNRITPYEDADIYDLRERLEDPNAAEHHVEDWTEDVTYEMVTGGRYKVQSVHRFGDKETLDWGDPDAGSIDKDIIVLELVQTGKYTIHAGGTTLDDLETKEAEPEDLPPEHPLSAALDGSVGAIVFLEGDEDDEDEDED